MSDIVERLRGKPVRHNYFPEADRQEAADEIERLRELFRLDGEQHAARIKEVQYEQDTRLAAYKAEIERLREEIERLSGLYAVLLLENNQLRAHYGTVR